MKIKITLIVLLLLAGLIGTVHALTVVEEAKLTASDGEAFDSFGLSVAISGDTTVIGARLSDGIVTNSGSAYIFQRSGRGWAEVAKLTASDGEYDDRFGRSVAISRDTAVVGAWRDDDLGGGSGSAYIFQRRGSSWTEVAKLTASDGEAGDLFGEKVAIGGDTAVIGAFADDDLGTNSGAAYIFQRRGRDWGEVAKLTASDGVAGDIFGNSVAIFEDTAVIGARRDDDLGNNSGAAYIFQRSGRKWVELVKLTASDGEAGDEFGVLVAISGDTAVIGAYRDDDLGSDSGAAYIFQRRGSSWTEVAKLTASDGAADDWFGVSVAISGDTAVIGSYRDDDIGGDSGAAYIFQRRGSSWTEVAKLTASDGAAGDFFGSSVAISRNTAVVGASQDGDLSGDSGAAYIFKLR